MQGISHELGICVGLALKVLTDSQIYCQRFLKHYLPNLFLEDKNECINPTTASFTCNDKPLR